MHDFHCECELTEEENWVLPRVRLSSAGTTMTSFFSPFHDSLDLKIF
jgi:hypothetical protein